MDKHLTGERIKGIAAAAVSDMGLEFVHAEVVGSKKNLTVRVFIDKPEGVTIEDCSTASRRIEAVLDADDFIPSSYVLEVSSPGIERELYSLNDFERFAGKSAKVKTETPVNGQKNFKGRIAAVEKGKIVFEDITAGKVSFPYEAVAKANLLIDLEEEFKRR